MKDLPDIPQVALRPPSEVMRLKRMGQMMPTRLSFLPTLLRRLAQERAAVRRVVWEMDADGFGHAVHAVRLAGREYSLVAISSNLPPDQRSDRVIATAWDAAFVLYDGIPDADAIARIRAQAPRQEAGRYCERDLVLSRANKSVRLWDHVTGALRAGRQPDPERTDRTGYLMRTTAVYGNGKFGIADRHLLADRPGLSGPFAAEMLTVWLIRHFTLDLVAHVGGADLDPAIARQLGIGNATGLGMAPFLVHHPVLLNNWMFARETALARVRAVEAPGPDIIDRLETLAARAAAHLARWQVPDAEHEAVLRQLEEDFAQFRDGMPAKCSDNKSVDSLVKASREGSMSLQELVVAMVIEPFGDLVDGLTDCMADPFGALPLAFADTDDLRAAIERHFGWVLARDYSVTDACQRFWYVSAAKAEPRIGDRFAEDGAELETPLDIARRVAALHADLPARPMPVSDLLDACPAHGLAVHRVGLAGRYPYGEIRDNLIAADCLPIDLLRCKLSFFGATRFDPKSDLWTRITLAQGAPLASDIAAGRGADDWWLPVGP